MAFTYSKLAEVTVGSGGAPSIDFINISQNYTDLVLKLSARATQDTVQAYMTFNGISANRSSRMLYGTGSSVASEPSSTLIYAYGNINASARTANTFANAEYYIPNYSRSNPKSIFTDAVEENNGTLAFSSMVASLWNNVTAITSISLVSGLGNFAQHSTASLYGIKATEY